jgi:hypothetical protein
MQEFDLPELPENWEWQSGNRGQTYYTTDFGTTYRQGGEYAGEYGLGGMSGQVYWDEGGEHIVQIRYIETIDENDDPRYSYPVVTETFMTEKGAHKSVPDLIRRL